MQNAKRNVDKGSILVASDDGALPFKKRRQGVDDFLESPAPELDQEFDSGRLPRDFTLEITEEGGKMKIFVTPKPGSDQNKVQEQVRRDYPNAEIVMRSPGARKSLAEELEEESEP